MQIYIFYILELTLLNLPTIVIQIVNNTILNTWNLLTIISVCIIGFNFFADVYGIMTINDQMSQDLITNELKIRIKKHQREKQMIIE